MKKLLIFALLLALVLALPVVASAQEPVQDSSYIEPEILAQIDMTDADRVIKLYYADIMEGFRDFAGIETVLTQYQLKRTSHNYNPLYQVLAGDTVLRNYQQNESGQLVQVELFDRYYQQAAREYVSNIALSRLGEGIAVKASYLLSDGMDKAIYYETNAGGFVYLLIDGHMKPGREYLFPLKDFFRVAEIQSMYYNFLGRSQGWGGNGLAFDGSGFEIHGDSYDMQFRYKPDYWAYSMWTIALIIGSLAVFATHRIKKRRSLRQQEGPRMLPDPTPRYAYCFHIL